MIRKLTIYVAFSMFCTLTNAQNNMPSALDQLASQCQQVIDLNDTIKAREVRLDELTWQLEELKQNWLHTCNEALSSPACDDNATRINTIDELIQLTDPKFEAGLLVQLKEAKNNPEIRTLVPDGPSSSRRKENAGQRNSSEKDNTTQPKQTVQPDHKTKNDSSETDDTRKENESKVVNPVTEEQPNDDSSTKKDESSTSPTSKDSKKGNPDKQVLAGKKDETGNKDKTKIEGSKSQENRNKTIELMNNKNKNQNQNK